MDSKQMNKIIAENVLGWKLKDITEEVYGNFVNHFKAYVNEYDNFSPSTSIVDAFRVVDRFNDIFSNFHSYSSDYTHEYNTYMFFIRWMDDSGQRIVVSDTGKSLPESICKCIISALGEGQSDERI